MMYFLIFAYYRNTHKETFITIDQGDNTSNNYSPILWVIQHPLSLLFEIHEATYFLAGHVHLYNAPDHWV